MSTPEAWEEMGPQLSTTNDRFVIQGIDAAAFIPES